MWKILRPPKHKPPVAAEKIDKEYKRLRLQVFIGIFIKHIKAKVRRKITLRVKIYDKNFGVLGKYASDIIGNCCFPCTAFHLCKT